ncbi:hypothetical protein ElyMa_004953700 [Elysia marginata]|uniref:DDE Tnp4 domain-containing protein n=1 Tax=Elysia marginata TaxID=1093978 RepID=A0AAV4J1W6_9GAST|nr:hypothetical protein ElyMa_004953700 [Elysia marginata]
MRFSEVVTQFCPALASIIFYRSAIDGKHIRIKKPNNSGSKFYDYKGLFSIALLAVTDASGKFIAIDAGSCGGNSDSGVFIRPTFGRRMVNRKLDLPEETMIPGTDIKVRFVFVADDVFPLRENTMKPFRHRQLTIEKEVFNYRLSRARNSVECSFVLLGNLLNYGGYCFAQWTYSPNLPLIS